MTAFERDIARALKQTAAAGTQIFLMHGNRDFLIGQQFCTQAGITLLKDPSVVDFDGEPVLLMHGDSLCTRDIAYMRLRRWLRNPLSLWLLRHLPLTKRQQLARKLRNESRQQTRQKAADIIDVTPEVIAPLLKRYGVSKLIHGHTHRPAIHDLQVQGQTAQRIVLGDWDAQGWALQIDESGYQLAPFPIIS
jgi:UDP-2,3-diacylglucosamine hydrolase